MAEDKMSWFIGMVRKSHPELSEDFLREELKKSLEPITYPDPMEPPWIAFPNIPGWPSIGWRMGPGEDYIRAFWKWFRGLSAKDREAYMATNPEPDTHSGLYSAFLKDLGATR